MKRWYVITPEYGTVIPVTDDGQGPLEYSADVIEIEAETARDAIALGVKEMLKPGRKCAYHERYRWCIDARLDGVSPYAGVKAFPMEDNNDAPDEL